MTATSAAANTAMGKARRAKHSRTLEVMARAGFVGYGIVHLAVAWLAVQIALGHPAEEGDQSGAFQVLAKQPAGRALLIVMMVGLAAMTVWQALEAAIGHTDERGKSRTFERLASAGRVVVYAALAYGAGRTAIGAPSSSSSHQQQTTAGLLGHSWGRALVFLAGLAVLGLGVGLVVVGVRRIFEKHLKMAQMRASVRKTTSRLGQIGYTAKGVAYAIAGILIGEAALDDSAAKSGGLDKALRTLADKPFGTVGLYLVAAGFAAFGVYCFFQSRYRKV